MIQNIRNNTMLLNADSRRDATKINNGKFLMACAEVAKQRGQIASYKAVFLPDDPGTINYILCGA